MIVTVIGVLIDVLIIIVFPQIALFLPNLFFGKRWNGAPPGRRHTPCTGPE